MFEVSGSSSDNIGPPTLFPDVLLLKPWGSSEMKSVSLYAGGVDAANGF